MKSASTRPLAAILLLLLLACFGLHARAAAQASIAGASSDRKAIARAAYREGVQAFAQAEHAQALERFDAADAAVSSPNVKLMRARCLVQLGRANEAYAMYSAAVDEASTSGDRRYEATAGVAAEEALALEAKIALLMLTVEDETGSAVLAINGEVLPRARWNQAVPVAPGAVIITLTGAHGQQDRIERTIMAGTRAMFELAVEARASQSTGMPVSLTAGPAVRASRTARTAQTVSTTSSGLPALPIALGVAGGAGLIAFAVFGALSNADLDALDRACPSREQCAPELADTASRGHTYQTVANVSLGAGLVLLAAGATLLLLELPSEDLQVALVPNGARVQGAL